MTQQTGPIYNIQLTAGLGLLNETRSLLDLWEPASAKKKRGKKVAVVEDHE